MKVIIKKSFREAFRYFTICLWDPNLHFAVEELPLPKILLRNRYNVFYGFRGFLKHPFLYITALLSFFFHWLKSSKDLSQIEEWLLENIGNIELVAVRILEYTSSFWKEDKIIIYPVIAKWGGERFGKIYIGVRPFSFLDNPDLGLVVHEMIHANNPKSALKDIEKQLDNFRSAEELATVILTRRIQKDILDIHSDKFQRLPVELKYAISDEKLRGIELEVKDISSFKKMVVRVSEYLK